MLSAINFTGFPQSQLLLLFGIKMKANWFFPYIEEAWEKRYLSLLTFFFFLTDRFLLAHSSKVLSNWNSGWDVYSGIINMNAISLRVTFHASRQNIYFWVTFFSEHIIKKTKLSYILTGITVRISYHLQFYFTPQT